MGEGEAREKAALRIMIEGVPSSPGGVGPIIRLIEKKIIKEKWKQRRMKREKTGQQINDSSSS